MGGGGKFALGILVMFGALVFFFFAFHPGGVAGVNGANVSNPAEMLQFLLAEFTKASGGTVTNAVLTSDQSSAANYPGYTAGSSDLGSTGPTTGGVQAV